METKLTFGEWIEWLNKHFRLSNIKCRDCDTTLSECYVSTVFGAIACCPDCKHHMLIPKQSSSNNSKEKQSVNNYGLG